MARYEANPLAMDAVVRQQFGLSEDRYYTVSMWPRETAGQVRVSNLTRIVRAKKVSKSDQ